MEMLRHGHLLKPSAYKQRRSCCQPLPAAILWLFEITGMPAVYYAPPDSCRQNSRGMAPVPTVRTQTYETLCRKTPVDFPSIQGQQRSHAWCISNGFPATFHPSTFGSQRASPRAFEIHTRDSSLGLLNSQPSTHHLDPFGFPLCRLY